MYILYLSGSSSDYLSLSDPGCISLFHYHWVFISLFSICLSLSLSSSVHHVSHSLSFLVYHLVTRLCSCGLLVLEGEGGADSRPLHRWTQPHRDLGRGHHDHRRWWVCHCHQAVNWVLWEVYSNTYIDLGDIWKSWIKNNKHFPSFNSCCFILIVKFFFWFHLVHNRYILQKIQYITSLNIYLLFTM